MSIPNIIKEKNVFRAIQANVFTTTKHGKIFYNGRRIDTMTKSGYRYCCFTYKGEVHKIAAHRLLWMKRNKKPIPYKMVINHINMVKDDNRAENIELTTYSGNNSHYRQLLPLLSKNRLKAILKLAKQSEDSHSAKFSNQQILRIRRDFKSGVMSLKDIEYKYNICRHTVMHILTGASYNNVPEKVNLMKKSRKLTKLQISEAKNLRKMGVFWKDLAKKYNVGRTSIRYYVLTPTY